MVVRFARLIEPKKMYTNFNCQLETQLLITKFFKNNVRIYHFNVLSYNNAIVALMTLYVG